ncbi:MAG: DNA-processing protein DprA [Verrucomicrobiae bacterium]|nr:DNA-processing protein DprA [Verrucomicrobiae bacterium]
MSLRAAEPDSPRSSSRTAPPRSTAANPSLNPQILAYAGIWALPSRLAARLSADTAASILGVGNPALLGEPLLGLIASRECPGHVLLETLDRVPEWVKAGRVILSGFHSPLEQQVLRSVLRRRGCVVKVLARGMTDYRPTAEERESLADGRILVITACPPEVRRTTRDTALARNRLVLALASEIITPYVADGSALADLLNGRRDA